MLSLVAGLDVRNTSFALSVFVAGLNTWAFVNMPSFVAGLDVQNTSFAFAFYVAGANDLSIHECSPSLQAWTYEIRLALNASLLPVRSSGLTSTWAYWMGILFPFFGTALTQLAMQVYFQFNLSITIYAFLGCRRSFSAYLIFFLRCQLSEICK